MMLIRMMLARNPLALGFLAVGAACAIVFFATLHPITGRIGGIWYLLTSWALPSVFVGSLALGLAWLIPTTSVPRIAVAVPLSFVLGLNTSLPLLADSCVIGRTSPRKSSAPSRGAQGCDTRSTSSASLGDRS